ncbi:hypothetical protein OPV22_008331 [Ensete ventricosum]|uniref:Serine/threonine-protein kinase PRP4 homolog n=1 Tax=Ensete ventricosum TaxID=4639 RepID=A0AAV8R825_ENSVE|nr:hypothetical protein OPV22_008331 [Ensete ventricosum]
MASEDSPSPTSGGKHWRSADDHEAETSPKRRKHRHRHHHRHHSRRGRESDDGAEEAAPLAEPETAFCPVPKPADEEREEGEILEDDEEMANLDHTEVDGFVTGGGSDSGSGEIKPDGVDVYSNLIVPGVKDTSGKNVKVLSHKQNTLKDEKMMDPARSCENSSLNDAAWMEVDTSDGENYVWKAESTTKSLELNDNKQMQTDRNDSESGVRSRSPVSKESSHAAKDRMSYDHVKKISDSDSEKMDSKQNMESKDSNRRASDRNRSMSPKSSRERYRNTRRSPASIKYHDEDKYRDKSRPLDHRKRRYDKVSEHSDMGDDQVCSQGNKRDNSKRQHRLDRCAAINQVSDIEIHNERESSGKRRHDDRHRSRERDREREKSSSSVRDTDKTQLDKRSHREKESSSHSRYDRQADKHEIWDRESEKEKYRFSTRDRVRDKPRDFSREKYVERERLRESKHEKERDGSDRDKNKSRDKENIVHKGKEHGDQMETDRISSRYRHRESRHPKYDEVEHHKDKSRSEAGLKKDTKKSIREEEEDYQEKIEQQLAKQHEDDVDKIKKESRKRRQAIMEKYRQRQLQQVESSSDGNVNESEKATSDKENLQGLLAISVDNKNGDLADKKMNNVGGLGEGTPKSEISANMFTDDIFGESPAGVCVKGKCEGPQVDRNYLHDNWDDAEGYYSYRFGEVLDGHYEVVAAHGKGVFSTVVRARDLKAGKGDPEEVAIKIIRNNETMYKAGQDELVILKKLAGADPEDKRHCVRFLSSFKYRNHLCLVFESLHMNLREVLKKFGRNIGLKLTAVRAYAKQLFIALKHLRNCGVLHCDIKPDNMLVNEAKNVLKLCDFGNAMFAGKNEITPYLVSRFYRAPEIILGLPYDHPMDVWSVGCCLYELYTGKVLFPGSSNNDMLRLHMELKGPFPKKMLRKGAFTDHHFDQDLNFHATEEDPVTKKPVKRLLINIKPKDIGALMSGFSEEDPKMLSNFKDLLDRIFVLDPEKRMTLCVYLVIYIDIAHLILRRLFCLFTAWWSLVDRIEEELKGSFVLKPFFMGVLNMGCVSVSWFCQGYVAINSVLDARRQTKKDGRLLEALLVLLKSMDEKLKHLQFVGSICSWRMSSSIVSTWL